MKVIIIRKVTKQNFSCNLEGEFEKQLRNHIIGPFSLLVDKRKAMIYDNADA